MWPTGTIELELHFERESERDFQFESATRYVGLSLLECPLGSHWLLCEVCVTLLPIAIWEWTPYWGPELQRELQPLGGRVSSCQTESDVARRVDEGACQVVIALPREQRLPWRSLGQWAESGRRVHVVLDSAGESYRWFLYELGMTSVLDFATARSSLVRAVSWDGSIDPSFRSITASPNG